MRFRRNRHEQKIFLIVSIIAFLSFIIFLFLTIYNDNSFLKLTILSILASVVLMVCSLSHLKDYILFENEYVNFLNNNRIMSKFHYNEIVKIYIPDQEAKKKKFSMSPVMFVLRNTNKYISSYSEDLEKYIISNLNNYEYYSKYKMINK